MLFCCVAVLLFCCGVVRCVPVALCVLLFFMFFVVGLNALASHAVSVYTRFSQAPFMSILAVGAEALSMTPSGDALFAS